MKTILSLQTIILLIISINSFGQNFVADEYHERIKSNIDVKKDYEELFKNNHLLDLWRKDSTRTYYFPDGVDSIASKKGIFVYDKYNKVTYVLQERPNNNSGWINVSRNMITYTDSGLLSGLVKSDWILGFWSKQKKTQYLYSPSGFTIFQISFDWDSISETWKNEYKAEFKYNALGQNNVVFIYTTDHITNEWVYVYKDSTVFNENNQELEQYAYYWNNSTFLWDKYERIIFSYETEVRSHNRDYWVEDEWKPFAKGDGYMIDSLTEHYDGYSWDEYHGWEHDYKAEIGYNMNGQTVYQESYRMPYGYSVWLGAVKYDRLYNYTGQSLETVYYEWDYWDGWNYQKKYVNGYNTNQINDYNANYVWYDEQWVKVESEIRFYNNISSIGDDNYSHLPIQVHPNPCTIQITLDFEDLDKSTTVYNIYTISGKMVDSGIIDHSKTISVHNLKRGHYLIIFEIGKINYTGKFIKL